MRELSLFSGAGGGLLGSKILGWTTVGYVEYEKYCQEIIKQRIADGILDAAPIFGDIKRFISEGWAERYHGKVDIVTGGFPCQPFSVAGKRAGEDDARNMWPATIETIRQVRPRYAFLENVPGLLTDKYIGRIFRDLAQVGYDARWCVLGASDVGANHRRKRLWILAYTEQVGRNEDGNKPRKQFEGQGKPHKTWGGSRVIPFVSPCGKRFGFSNPDMDGGFDGMADWVDRLKAIGNGQVPLCMAYAYEILSQGIDGEGVMTARFISFVYEPKRWLKRESYYKCYSLYRKFMKKKTRSLYCGEIGRLHGVRFYGSGKVL